MYRRSLGGVGSAQITRHLNECGIPNGAGNRWCYQVVLQTLDSGFAAGLLSRTRVKMRGTWVTPPCWEREYLPGAHQTIITDETWHAYVAARAGRTRMPA